MKDGSDEADVRSRISELITVLGSEANVDSNFLAQLVKITRVPSLIEEFLSANPSDYLPEARLHIYCNLTKHNPALLSTMAVCFLLRYIINEHLSFKASLWKTYAAVRGTQQHESKNRQTRTTPADLFLCANGLIANSYK